jgi:hypothetical protein
MPKPPKFTDEQKYEIAQMRTEHGTSLTRLALAFEEPRSSVPGFPGISLAQAAGGGSIMRGKSPGGLAGQGHPGNRSIYQ